jgi:hypothetical protein
MSGPKSTADGAKVAASGLSIFSKYEPLKQRVDEYLLASFQHDLVPVEKQVLLLTPTHYY